MIQICFFVKPAAWVTVSETYKRIPNPAFRFPLS